MMDEYVDVDLTTLVERAQLGDESAFEKICTQFRPLYFAQWTKFHNLKIEKDDWLQEMTLITYRSVMSFKPRQFERSFGSYLRCAINFRCIDEWRRQRAKRYTEDSWDGIAQLQGMVDDSIISYNNAQDLLIVRETVESFINGPITKKERQVLHELIGLEPSVDKQNLAPNEALAKKRTFTRSRARLRKKLEELLE